MKILKNNSIFFAIIIGTPLFLIGCESNFKDIQKINFNELSPSTDAENFNLKYTDSGRIKSILISKQMLEYSSVRYPFAEFPKGIDLTMFDKNGKRTFVKSDYAINFKSIKIIDLQGNVTITDEIGQKMTTNQLYFDQKTEWFYTENKFVFESPDGTLTGEGVDFSKDFKIMNTQRLSGQLNNSK